MLRRGRFRSDELTGDGIPTIFRDTLFSGMGALAGLAIVILAAVNPVGKDAESTSVPPGNITIQTYWPDDIDADVDTWVKGPEGAPVGYSNKGGEHYNLLRDDLGIRSEDDPVNFEVVYSRGLPAGGHCVNIHLYSNKSGVLPIKVKVTVTVTKGNAGGVKGGGDPALVTDVLLRTEGEEVNVFCFVITKQGDLDTSEVYQSNAVKLRSPSAM